MQVLSAVSTVSVLPVRYTSHRREQEDSVLESENGMSCVGEDGHLARGHLDLILPRDPYTTLEYQEARRRRRVVFAELDTLTDGDHRLTKWTVMDNDLSMAAMCGRIGRRACGASEVRQSGHGGS